MEKYTYDEILNDGISYTIQRKVYSIIEDLISIIKKQREEGWSDKEILDNIINTYKELLWIRLI